MSPGLPVGGGVSTSPSEVGRAPWGLGQFWLLCGDQRFSRWMASPQENMGWSMQWHGWPGWPFNQLAKLDMWNWKILNISACDLGVLSVPTAGQGNTIPSRRDGESGHLDAILKQCLMKWENTFQRCAPWHISASAEVHNGHISWFRRELEKSRKCHQNKNQTQKSKLSQKQMYFLLLKKEFFCPRLFSPQAVPCYYLKMTFPLGFPEMLSVTWLEQVTLDLSSNSRGSPGFSGCPLGGPWRRGCRCLLLISPETRGGRRPIPGSTGGWSSSLAKCWGPRTAVHAGIQSCGFSFLFSGRCGGGYSCILRIPVPQLSADNKIFLVLTFCWWLPSTLRPKIRLRYAF